MYLFDLDLHLMHGSLDSHDSASQTASRSVQPFYTVHVTNTDRHAYTQTMLRATSVAIGRILCSVCACGLKMNDCVICQIQLWQIDGQTQGYSIIPLYHIVARFKVSLLCVFIKDTFGISSCIFTMLLKVSFVSLLAESIPLSTLVASQAK